MYDTHVHAWTLVSLRGQNLGPTQPRPGRALSQRLSVYGVVCCVLCAQCLSVYGIVCCGLCAQCLSVYGVVCCVLCAQRLSVYGVVCCVLCVCAGVCRCDEDSRPV